MKAICGAASAAARVLWGNEASVLVGDFLLGQAFKMMVEVGSLQCLDVLSTAAAVIAEGEVMQLSAAKDTATTEDAYLAVIRAKTAALFAAACEVGPILAGRAKAEIAACRGYGANLGIAFQLIDDALDYGGSSAKLGKNVGDDFREGKITLPVILSFRRGTESEREFWRRTLEQRRNRRRRSRDRAGDDEASTARSKIRSNAPAIMARWRATRSNCSPPRRGNTRCSTRSNSRFSARIERRPRGSYEARAEALHQRAEIREAGGDHRRVVDRHRLQRRQPHDQEAHGDAMVEMSGDAGRLRPAAGRRHERSGRRRRSRARPPRRQGPRRRRRAGRSP